MIVRNHSISWPHDFPFHPIGLSPGVGSSAADPAGTCPVRTKLRWAAGVGCGSGKNVGLLR